MKIQAIIIGLCIGTFLHPTIICNSECLYIATDNRQVKAEPKNVVIYHPKITIVSKEETTDKKLSQEDVDLISRVVMAEAEDEPFEGKRYVIDTILNRVNSKHFPNTVHDVIYQHGQFTSMWNGRYNRCTSNSELNNLINEEYINRTNSNVMFFTADHYGENGKPSFRIGNHYFANY